MMLLLLFVIGSAIAEDYIHDPIQYQSQGNQGSYNFGYDTGLYGSHQFHHETKDDNGVVRGKYGYTDPNGKLRLVHYTSGPNGYQVYPDLPVNSVPVASPSAQVSKVSSRITYPVSKVAPIKSAKQIVIPLPPAKTVQREHVVTKTHFSPADTFRARYTSGSFKGTKRAEVKGGSVVVEELQQQQSSPVVAVKSLSLKSANRPIPITPSQYRSKYPPAGRYSRCYCE